MKKILIAIFVILVIVLVYYFTNEKWEKEKEAIFGIYDKLWAMEDEIVSTSYHNNELSIGVSDQVTKARIKEIKEEIQTQLTERGIMSQLAYL
ncbi:hypothetical protein [Radiobacillus deserti]|uniref:Uncharacterized protein n=1 Tax=Radiobacillus deserti TaxID=2594883 RepID=A0A516KIB1_9BACI|nr:hypothetical protein [Radiobacillus deserti]QDP41133.1 hypothetical protein FN924_13600 [Radiobacillus deserti]